ncbi:MAG: prephenate/arogenate dehydrogenase family protein [Pseudomonadota bacterium]
MTEASFERAAIIGIGLIGSSIARAIEKTAAAGVVSLFDIDAAVREDARTLALGEVADDIAAAVDDADLVILCTPVGRLGAVCAAMADHLKAGAIVTDVGSVKAKALTEMRDACPDHIHLIPGHPIAGTEKSGPAAGFGSLFQDAWHILTPLSDQNAAYDKAVDALAVFWRTLGARVEVMDAERHDRVLAITSHLPHLIAYNIVSTAYDMETVEEGEVVKFSAGGFRDFTRIAASDPTMWRDVFLANKDAVLECLGRFSEDLAALQRAIRWGDGDALFREFERARGIRRAILDAGQDVDEPNFGRNKPPSNTG